MPPRPRPPPPSTAIPRAALAALAAVLLVTTLAYWRVRTGEFMFDDSRSIERNLAVKDLGAYLGDPFVHSFLHGGRPVADVVFAVGYAIGRLDPRPYHLIGIGIHLAAVVLAFLLGRRLLRLAGAARPDAVALVAAGLFALHPLQTQAVSYMVQQAETLASALYLATLVLLLRADERRPTTGGRVAYAAALLAFVLALGSKAIAATVPVAYLLLAGLVPGPAARPRLATWGRRLAGLVPFALLDVWFSVRTVGALEGHADAGFSVPGLPPKVYFLTQWRVVATYLRMVFWPAGQNVDWDFPPSRELLDPVVLGAGLLLTALFVGGALLAARARAREDEGGAAARVAGAGLLWFFLLLGPTSSVLPLADVVMEHRLYLALLGLFLALGVGGERLVARLSPRLGARAATRGAAALVALVLVALGVATWQRNAVWETRLEFWADVARKSPLKARAYLGYGYALRDRGRYDEAVEQYRIALKLVGADADLRSQIRRNLGSALIYGKRFDEAEVVLKEAVADDPANVDLLVNLGVVAQRRNDLAGMELWARRALTVNPSSGDALQLLGITLIARGDLPGAIGALERASRLDPDDGIRALNLGLALEGAGRKPEACAAYGRAAAARLTPDLRERARQQLAGCGR